MSPSYADGWAFRPARTSGPTAPLLQFNRADRVGRAVHGRLDGDVEPVAMLLEQLLARLVQVHRERLGGARRDRDLQRADGHPVLPHCGWYRQDLVALDEDDQAHLAVAIRGAHARQVKADDVVRDRNRAGDRAGLRRAKLPGLQRLLEPEVGRAA